MFTDQNVLFALGITLLAGMATGIGSLLAFFVKRTNYFRLFFPHSTASI